MTFSVNHQRVRTTEGRCLVGQSARGVFLTLLWVASIGFSPAPAQQPPASSASLSISDVIRLINSGELKK